MISINHHWLSGWAGGGTIPQFAGLKVRTATGTIDLALIAVADAPAGGVPMVHKNGTNYALWLVETNDPNASSVRIQTGAGTKAARISS